MTTREVKLGAGIFLGSLSILLLRFLAPRPIGMADNGDGKRILCQLGGNQLDRPLETSVRFVYQQGPGCYSNYVTSQKWLDKTAQLLGRAAGSTAALNLLILGALCCVLIALAVAAIVIGLDLSRRNSVIAAFLLLLVAADSAFFGYSASVLSEGAAFVGILLMTGGLLLMTRAGWWRYSGALITVGGGIIGINAKSQTLLLLPFFALALLFIRPQDKRGSARWLTAAIVLVAVVSGTLLIQARGPSGNAEYREANVYNSIFSSILVDGQARASNLAALELPPEFAKYAGTNIWDANAASFDPLWSKYRSKINQQNVLRFYATHPGQTLEILQRAGEDTLRARPENLGSFGENSGQAPLAKEYRVPVLSGLTSAIAPLGLFFLIPLWLVLCWGGIRSLLVRRGSREIGAIVLMLTFFAVTQFSVSALADGVEGIKHQLLTLFPTLLAVVLMGLSFLTRKSTGPSEVLPPLKSHSEQPLDKPDLAVSPGPTIANG